MIVIWYSLLHVSSIFLCPNPPHWLTRISLAEPVVPTAGLRLGERLLLGLRKRLLAIARWEPFQWLDYVGLARCPFSMFLRTFGLWWNPLVLLDFHVSRRLVEQSGKTPWFLHGFCYFYEIRWNKMTFVTQKPAFFYHKKLHQVRVILAHNAQVEVSIPQQWAMLQGRRRTRPMRRMSDSKGVQNGGFYTWGYPQIIWLVVWLPFFTFPYIGLLIIPID